MRQIKALFVKKFPKYYQGYLTSQYRNFYIVIKKQKFKTFSNLGYATYP